MSKLDEARKFASQKATYETDLVSEINERIKVLKDLGFEYSLVKGTAQKHGDPTRGHVSSDKPCPVCNFQTEPPHDKRKHRHQVGFEERAFTAPKLRELGLIKVETRA